MGVDESNQSDPGRRSMTVTLTDVEMQTLEVLSKKKGASKVAILRQALRLYEIVETRAERGTRLILENENTNERTELLLG